MDCGAWCCGGGGGGGVVDHYDCTGSTISQCVLFTRTRIKNLLLHFSSSCISTSSSNEKE